MTMNDLMTAKRNDNKKVGNGSTKRAVMNKKESICFPDSFQVE